MKSCGDTHTVIQIYFTDSIHYLPAFLFVLHTGTHGRLSIIGRDVRNRVHLYTWMRENARDRDLRTGDALAQV